MTGESRRDDHPIERVVLRARAGSPLADASTRAVVRSAAEALGERTGVVVRVGSITDDSIELLVEGSRLEAMAAAAELRRSTERWSRERGDGPLWDADFE